ncbi:biopolymer transporter ExbD [Pseudovibrio exalbescens]|uniref:ExbD/TolR family protein n=1 Tax=Pseudovibrio exalbescens TaxID=197461 RepID=UPI00236633C1|nr:biopolymer transporter ExbD [Pseudovibrio exalbescens]MDD7910139.1 biopolymer transporter ExbD [Pseudovibrio exalbescens]
MRLKTTKKKSAFESTIPLINIVFLMLIFFMVAGTIDTDVARDIHPPQVSGEDERDRVANALVIDEEGIFHFQDAVIAPEDLAAVVDQGEEQSLLIIADKKLKGTELTAMLKDLKAAGIQKIELVTVRATQ